MTKSDLDPLAGLSSVKLAALANRARSASVEAAVLRREPIAIVGLASRFPTGGAASEGPEGFWQLLMEGRDAVGPIPRDRWDADAHYDPDPAAKGKSRCRHGAFLKDVRGFDSRFFQISGHEADRMDPQQRLLLELVWEALESSGHAPSGLAGSRTGIFAAIASTEYAHGIIARGDLGLIDGHYGSGNAVCFAAGRLAYALNTRGPAVTIDTACSSSLVAIHQACMSLRAGECDLALVASAHLMLVPGAFTYLSQSGALASNGRCKAFDESADGFGRGEGGAVVVLKRLSDAMRDKDAVLAVVRGSAVNHGGASGGLTVPNGPAQAAVITAALADAGIDAGQVDYVEAHGTGTLLGDPIELNALGSVFAPGRDRSLLVGSVKNNVGHLEAAAGLCGLVKIVLALGAGTIPPHINLSRPNPHVNWQGLPIRIPQQPQSWPRSDRPRFAGLSSFGLSGTNAHLVIEEAPRDPRPRTRPMPAPHLFCLSARSGTALAALCTASASHVLAAPDGALGDVCFTNNVGRTGYPHRLAIVAADRQSLAAELDNAAKGRTGPSSRAGQAAEPPPLAFLVTGQGAAFAGMTRQLYDAHPYFRHCLDRCADILAPHLDRPLQSILFPGRDEADCLGMTGYAQPALAAAAWSLAELWRSFGVTPAAVLGHSLGEYVAAAIAGMVDIQDLLPFIAARARLMQSLPRGGVMVTVGAGVAEIEGALAPCRDMVSIAALNGPGQSVLAGRRDMVAKVLARLGEAAGPTHELPVSHAFHSPLMDEILPQLERLAASVPWRPAQLPLISNVTGEALPADIVPDAASFARHARAPVRFADGMAALWRRGCRVFVEIGPRPVLSALGRGCVPAAEAHFIPILAAPRPDWESLQWALGRLWLLGYDLDWSGIYRSFDVRCRPQPPYPFEHRPHWLAEAAPVETMPQTAPQQAHSAPLAAATAAPDEEVMRTVLAEFAHILGEDPADIDPCATLVELGADSILIGEAVRAIKARFHVQIDIRDLFGPLSTIEALGRHVAAHRPAPAAPTPAAPVLPVAEASPPLGPPGEMATLFRRQLDLVEGVIRQQLAALGQNAAQPAQPAAVAPVPAAGKAAVNQDFGPYRPPRRVEAGEHAGDKARRRFIAEFALRYNARTATSKKLAEDSRLHLADSRATAGFRPSIKELAYPITGARCQGCRLWDVDGNEYVDISMDFGANLFGHRAPFLMDALQAQLEQGTAMAPRAAHLAEAARLLCRLTGMDRAVFCQSGTEAVMTAVRLARLATRRPHVVIFGKSYHGHSDGLLAAAITQDGARATVPASAGIVPCAVAEVTVLDYDDPAALDTLRRMAPRLAAVLVEPVQSRALEVQPCDFLHALRAVTREIGGLLIFDEMITGFRIHPGGAQAYFGVEADLATYGKAMGGGIQVAAIAGRGGLVDGIDGGLWRFGDDSIPAAPTTFFAGTFNGNPMAAAAAHAVLSELDRLGPGFQQTLNEKTSRFVGDVNAWLEAEDVPLRLVNFGSMFRFSFRHNLDLIFHLLMEQGVFVWEGRNCFLSAAHDEAALAFVVGKIKASVITLRDAGLLGGGKKSAAKTGADAPVTVPLSEAQQQLRLVSTLSGSAPLAYVEPILVEIEGELDERRLGEAVQKVVDRHEALRTTLSPDGRSQLVHPRLAVPLTMTSAPEASPDIEGEARQWVRSMVEVPFDLAVGPLLRVGLFKLGNGSARLLVVAHHIIADGWSMGVILNEIMAAYAAPPGTSPFAGPARQFRDHLAWLANGRPAGDIQADEAYWRARIDPAKPSFGIPGDKPLPAQWSWLGACRRVVVSEGLRSRLKILGQRHQATLFATLMAGWLSYLYRISGVDDLLVGFPVLGRAPGDRGDMVGFATNVVPFRSRVPGDAGFARFLEETTAGLRKAQSHGAYPFARLLRLLGLSWKGDRMPLVAISFNLDRPTIIPEQGGLRTRLAPLDFHAAKLELSVNVLDLGGSMDVDFIYSTDLYSDGMMAGLAEGWLAWLENLCVADPALPLAARPVAFCLPTPAAEPAGEPVKDRAAPVAPRNDMERRLLEHWASLLGTSQFGVEDDFFELGGHSLMADEAVLWARRTFNVEIPLSALFDQPTVAGLAAALASAASSGKARIGRLARDKFRAPRAAVLSDNPQ